MARPSGMAVNGMIANGVVANGTTVTRHPLCRRRPFRLRRRSPSRDTQIAGRRKHPFPHSGTHSLVTSWTEFLNLEGPLGSPIPPPLVPIGAKNHELPPFRNTPHPFGRSLQDVPALPHPVRIFPAGRAFCIVPQEEKNARTNAEASRNTGALSETNTGVAATPIRPRSANGKRR